MLNKYITDTMGDYLLKEDVKTLQEMIDKEIFKDIDAYLSSADPMLLKDIAKITEMAKRTDYYNFPYDG